MARREDDLTDALRKLPWQISSVAALVFYVGPQVALLVSPHSKSLILWLPVLQLLAVAFLIAAVFSFIRSWRQDRQLDRQESIETIRELPWKQFEELLAAAYRRQGFAVHENLGMGADGGIDLRLRKDGLEVLVQCKHWKRAKVDVRVVREMYGLMHVRGAARAIIVTSGSFTLEAVREAKDLPIDLVGESELLNLIREVQTRPAVTPPLASMPKESSAHLCPRCGSALTQRVARKGPHAGNAFWGCSAYPRCRYIK